jgi:hypothetical protein
MCQDYIGSQRDQLRCESANLAAVGSSPANVEAARRFQTFLLRREPETSLCVLIARRMEPELLRQFVSKATRPKLPSGLLLSPGLSAFLDHLLPGLLNLLFHEFLDSLRCFKATAVAFVAGRR